MNKNLLLTAIIAMPLALASCSDPKKLNESNIEKALNTYFDKPENKKCETFDIKGNFYNYQGYKGEQYYDQPAMAQLLDLGMVTKKDVIVKGDFGTSSKAAVFTPTEKLKPYIVDKKQILGGTNTVLCYGKYKVKKITNWDEPSMNITNVQYTFDLVDVPDFLKDPNVSKHFNALNSDLTNIKKGSGSRINIKLTQNGWEVTTNW